MRPYNMNRASNVEFVVWLIVAVVVMAAKGLGKLATPPEKAAPASPPRRPPPPKPVVRRTTRRPDAEVKPPVIAKSQAVVTDQPAPTPPAPAATPAQPTRSAQWAAALRDKQNVRNIIISAEIIGPPRGA